MKHADYLTHVVEAVRKFGRDALELVNHPESEEFGFRTPEGIEILLSLQDLRDYFDVTEEDEDHETGLPGFPILWAHTMMVEDAVAEGLRLRALH